MHRFAYLIALLAAVVAPIHAGLICSLVASVFRKKYLADFAELTLPAFTQWWILQKQPFAQAMAVFALMNLVSGLWLLRKPGNVQSAKWLLLLCCLAFVVAIIFISSVLLAVSLPFIALSSETS